MVTTVEEQLQAIGRTMLATLVQRALGRRDAEIGEWQCQPIYGGVEMASSLYRFSGDALAAGARLPWTLILKLPFRLNFLANPRLLG